MKKILFSLLLAVWVYHGHAQLLNESCREYVAIKQFLEKKGNWNKEKPALVSYGCLIDSIAYKSCGIYTFKQMSSNAEVFIYLKESNGKITIIEDYMIVNCLKEVNHFFTRHWGCLTHTDAINYAMAVLTVLKQKESTNQR